LPGLLAEASLLVHTATNVIIIHLELFKESLVYQIKF